MVWPVPAVPYQFYFTFGTTELYTTLRKLLREQNARLPLPLELKLPTALSPPTPEAPGPLAEQYWKPIRSPRHKSTVSHC